MSKNDRPPDSSQEETADDRQIEDLAARYADRLIAGENLPPEQILSEHPTLGPEILEHLEAFVKCSPDASPSTPLGTLGDYTLRRQIGRGGMGVVYDAWQNSLDRQVALKVLPAGVAADSKAFMRFMREAKTAAQLRHQNVVAVFGMGVEQNTPYYAMEFVEGETLAQVLARIKEVEPEGETAFGQKDRAGYFEKIAQAFAEAAEGLQHAHSKSVIHRDIKPSNLILDGEGRLRILDFGLARLEGQESLTASGDLLGTPLYMSPEQARRRKIPVDHRTDIYSLGATLYEFLTLRPPFRGKDNHDTLSQIIERDPVEPRKINARVPKDLETIVLKCVRKEPGDRYGTAEALAQDLRRFVRGDAIEARPQAGWERAARRLWRHRVRALVGLLLLVSIGALWWLGIVQTRAAGMRVASEYRGLVLKAMRRIELASLTLKLEVGEGAPLGAVLGAAHPLGIVSLREATSMLDEAEGLLPGRPDAPYQRARAIFFLGDAEAAYAHVKDLSHSFPHFIPGLLLEATIVDCRGEHERSRTMLALAEKAAGDDGSRAWLRAMRATDRGEWKDAEAAWSTLIGLDENDRMPFIGTDFMAHLRRGQVRLQMNDPVGALKDFVLAEGLAPGALEPLLLEGKVFHILGKEEIAGSIFERLLESAESKDEAALAVAELYGELGDCDKHLAWVRRAPTEEFRAVPLSYALTHVGKWEEAITAARRAIELDPNSPNAHGFLGWLLMFYGGDREESARELEEMLRLDPRNPGRCVEALTSYRRWLDSAGARRVLEAGLRLDPESPKLLLQKACWLVLEGHVSDGLQLGAQVADDHPMDWDICFNYGAQLFFAGKLEESGAAFRQAAQIDTSDSLCRGMIGRVLELLGRQEEAIEAYRGAVHLYPFNFEAARCLCRLFGDLGRWDEATEVCLEILAADPGNEQAPRRISAILRDHIQTKRLKNSEAIVARLELLAPPDKATPEILEALAYARALSPRRSEKLKAVSTILRGVELSASSDARQGELLAALKVLVEIAGGSGDERLIAEIRAAEPAGISETAARYLEARLLEDAGKCREAARKYEVILGENPQPGPLVALARNLSAAREFKEAEELLRKGLRESKSTSRTAWSFWAALNLQDLPRGPAEVLCLLPPDAKDGSPIDDLRWLLETIRAGGPIRIDCGGKGFTDLKGRTWERDRLALGGYPYGPLEAEISGTSFERLYQTFRGFSEVDGTEFGYGYLVPLPPGKYRVTLHFAVFGPCAKKNSVFNVRLGKDTVLEGFDPTAAGCRVAQERTFEVAVENGLLEIEFIPRGFRATVAGIEIERID